MTDSVTCSSSMHTAYRSVLFVTEETHCPICCPFSGCVSAAAAAAANPTVPDATEINQTVRTLKSQYIDARFWRIEDPQRIVGMPDARYRNNSDKSSQRARVIFIAEDRKWKKWPQGRLPDKHPWFSSHKITATVQVTTVAEPNALMT